MLFGTRLVALILAALSLGPSFAHVLERPADSNQFGYLLPGVLLQASF